MFYVKKIFLGHDETSRDLATHSRHRSLVLDVSLGCAESNLLRVFSVAEKRSLTPAFKNDEYEIREAAGTMDPLTPNRVAFPGLADVACRSFFQNLEMAVSCPPTCGESAPGSSLCSVWPVL